MVTKEQISLKGTRNGILVSISQECPLGEALEHLRSAIAQRRSFFAGSPVSLDLGWREVREEEADLLVHAMKDMGVRLLGIISTSQTTRKIFEARGLKVIIGTLGLARHGARNRGKLAEEASAARPTAAPAPDNGATPTPPAATAGEPGEKEQPQGAPEAGKAKPAPAPAPAAPARPGLEGADTMLVRRNLRSGQRIQFEGNVVVVGDVNAGAEISAGGDVIVLGHLRGTAHAGVGGKHDAVVLALNLHATQVRIGDLVGFVQGPKSFHSNAAVMARIQDGAIATCIYGS